jgi:hypothetical protein
MVKIIALIFSFCVLCTIIELTRQEKLTFKYAFGWMAVSLLAVVCSVFDKSIERVAHFFGFELASNFIFFGLLGSLVFMSLLMTLFLCQQNSRNDKMAQRLGLFELELDQLKEKLKNKNDK